MARQKKEGEKISLYLEKQTVDRLRKYAEEKGQTLTMAMERAINGYINAEEKANSETN